MPKKNKKGNYTTTSLLAEKMIRSGSWDQCYSKKEQKDPVTILVACISLVLVPKQLLQHGKRHEEKTSQKPSKTKQSLQAFSEQQGASAQPPAFHGRRELRGASAQQNTEDLQGVLFDQSYWEFSHQNADGDIKA